MNRNHHDLIECNIESEHIIPILRCIKRASNKQNSPWELFFDEPILILLVEISNWLQKTISINKLFKTINKVSIHVWKIRVD